MSSLSAVTSLTDQEILRSPPGMPGGAPLVIPFALFRLISRIIWRLPGQGARKMAEFSHVEAGSGLDMLAAAEACADPLLRKKYFLHAMDELKHSRLFRERALALSASSGGRDRAVEAVLDDAGFIPSHGIREIEPLYLQHGELEFLAFVWLHERAGASQFAVYAELMQEPEARAMFDEIARDERFHIAYSRAELERRMREGPELRRAVWRAVLAVRLRDAWQAWGRLAFRMGDFMSGLWLGLLYWVVVTPFALVARRREELKGGFVAGGEARGKGYGEEMV